MATLDDMSRDSEQMPRLPRGLGIGIRTALDYLSREVFRRPTLIPSAMGLWGPGYFLTAPSIMGEQNKLNNYESRGACFLSISSMRDIWWLPSKTVSR